MITEDTKQAIHHHFTEAGRKCGEDITALIPPVPMPNGVGGGLIPDPAVPIIAEAIMSFTAEVIQAYIDAGSERDATMENETLFAALEGEIGGWGDDYTKYQKEEA